MVCARKEIQLQHFAIAKKLSKVDDELFCSVYDCKAEMDGCKQALGVDGHTSRQLRNEWRELEFENWSAMDYAGVGARH